MRCFFEGFYNVKWSGIGLFARTRIYTPENFVCVSQECAEFVFRHATLRTTGICEANTRRSRFTASH
jgi:hypothetical protein